MSAIVDYDRPQETHLPREMREVRFCCSLHEFAYRL